MTSKTLIKTALTILIIIGLFFYIKPFKTLSADVVNGEAQYSKHCQSCHGDKGLGDGPQAAELEKQPSNINKKFKTSWMPDNRLTRRILVGKTKSGMPAFKDVILEKDAEDILAYVRSIE